jgi:PBP1b-binding outer membrane lipoprotein LpoB
VAEGDEMKKKKIICLFVLLILVFSSCRSSRSISDIKPAMTKEQVISLWGATNLITYKNADGYTLEIWQYNFASTKSTCLIIFVEDRVVRTECSPRDQR